MRNLKIIFIFSIIFTLVLLVNVVASMNPEETGITKYQEFLGKKNINKNLDVSEFYILEYSVNSPESILGFQGSSIADMIKPTGNKLWFMLNDIKEPEGIMITNNEKPLLMGGENFGKELYRLYSTLMKEFTKGDEIMYFSFQGGGMFIVKSDKKEDIWLTERAAQLLQLEPEKKYQSAIILEQMKAKVAETSN